MIPRVLLFHLPPKCAGFPISLGYIAASLKKIGNSRGQQSALYFGANIYDNIKKFGIHLIKKKRPLFLSPGCEFETEYMKGQEILLINKRYKAEQIMDSFLLNRGNKDKLSNYVSS